MQTLLRDPAQFFSTAVPGRVTALAGISPHELIAKLEAAEDLGKLAIVLGVGAALPPIGVQDIIDSLAKLALDAWPIWFDDEDFSGCSNDTAGRAALQIKVRAIAARLPSVSANWANSAASLALSGRVPRVRSHPAEVELRQLCQAISPSQPVLIFDGRDLLERSAAEAAIHALEWIARSGPCLVIMLFKELPPNEPPFERVLFGASDASRREHIEEGAAAGGPFRITPLWVGPIRGRPHPLSNEEKRLAEVLSRDGELAGLFSFNQVIETVHGGRPRVDMLWRIGRLVVEVDGYPDHANRAAFARDRQRDFELLLSGYVVLRLANDEVAQDLHRAVEKIRSIVRHQRSRLTMGSK
jgi:very-short-patch-repair endonuclease